MLGVFTLSTIVSHISTFPIWWNFNGTYNRVFQVNINVIPYEYEVLIEINMFERKVLAKLFSEKLKC